LALVLLLVPAAAGASTLIGHVTRSDTQAPVAGAQILIRGTRLMGTSLQDGSYSIPGIPAGPYGVTCAAPGLLGSSTANAVDLSQDATRDFALHPLAAETYSVSGTVRCAGTPCGGALVLAYRGTTVRGFGVSAPGGAYSLEGLTVGTFNIVALALGFLPTQITDYPISAPGDAGAATLDIDLVAAPAGGFTITGVVGLSDNPLDRSGSAVRCNGQAPPVSTTTDVGGSYHLAGVPAGLLSFSATHAGYRDTSRIDVLVAADIRLDFVVSKGGGGTSNPTYTVSGTVVAVVPEGATAPPSVARVNLWSQSGGTRRNAVPDADGAYRIEGIPPGTFQVGCAREGFLSQTSDPFELSGDHVVDFSLVLDPAYDWGPGDSDGNFGCGCQAAAGESLLVLLAFALLRRRRWRT
jgi:hypothetical protein